MNSKVVSQQGTTVVPIPSGGPEEEEQLLFPREAGQTYRRLMEAKRDPKQIMKAAEGKRRVKLSKKPKTYSPGKNLRASANQLKSKKRGPFGEAYKPVAAPAKGNRVKESGRQLREAVSAEDERRMIQRALDKEYPQPKNQLGQTAAPVGAGQPTPYVKDVFPSEGLVVFERLNLLWGADYSISEEKGSASVSNIRRVKTQYVDVDEDVEGEDAKESLKEATPPGREKQVKKLKRMPGIENPWAVAWSQHSKHGPPAGKD